MGLNSTHFWSDVLLRVLIPHVRVRCCAGHKSRAVDTVGSVLAALSTVRNLTMISRRI